MAMHQGGKGPGKRKTDNPKTDRRSAGGPAGFKPAGRPRKEGDASGSRPYGAKPGRPFSDRPAQDGGDAAKRPYRRPAADRPEGDRKPFRAEGDRKPFRAEGDRKPFRAEGDRKPFRPNGDRKPFERGEEGRKPASASGKPFARRESPAPDGESQDRKRDFRGPDRPAGKRPFAPKEGFDKKPRTYGRPDEGEGRGGSERPYRPRKAGAEGSERPFRSGKSEGGERPYRGKSLDSPKPYRGRNARIESEYEGGRKPRREMPEIEESMPLNKFIAHSGECSRRDAAELVRQGKVKVNGELILDPGYKVQPGDQVTSAGKKLTPTKNLVYILLNKPKDFITTTEDDHGRHTVMDLVANSGVPRLFPVGRLDRNTTGLLLLTNDGDLAQKLSHPKYEIKKIYQVTLDKNLTKPDFEKILAGVELEDGVAPVDALHYLEAKNELGIEIHSGRNRIVRRIFESLGYEVEKLDRVVYAGLTKKNLPRGKWRLLTEKEIIVLKHFKS